MKTRKGKSPVSAASVAREGAEASEAGITLGVYLLLATAFVGLALLVYRPAFAGPFLSDDNHYIENNLYVHTLSFDNFLTILEPTGPVTIAVVNYSPVQIMIHSFAWSLFGADTAGHHMVNVVLHALASVLLISLFVRTGVPRTAAVLGGAFFLLHPANVEAVAWISQLKSSSSLVFSLLALLVFPRRPAAGTVFFVLSLLAKPTAAVVLPVAALFALTERDRIARPWWVLWVVIFVAFAIVEFSVHQRSGAAEAILYDTPFDLVKTVVALALRYIVMGATSLGVSAFHEPEPVRSLLDPWWLGAIPVLGLLAWRLVVVWRRREPEVAYWLWAIVSFGPISQVFPFLYPLADRYLYFILPGLIGAALLLGQAGLARMSLDSDRLRNARRVAAVAGVAVCVGMGVASHDRAGIWRYTALLLADAAKNYPNGMSASMIRSKRAAIIGDAGEAAVALQAAVDRGFNRFEMIFNDSSFDPVRDQPPFRSVVDAMALGWIVKIEARESPSQGELRMAAHAHFARREYAQTRRMLKRALAQGGILDEGIREDLQGLSTIPE